MNLRSNIFNETKGSIYLQDRGLVDASEWIELCELAGVDVLYGYELKEKNQSITENNTFIIRQYDWEEPNAPAPNFEHKPTGFKLWWYKYAFRSTTMNGEVTKEELLEIFQDCINSLKDDECDKK